MLDRYFKAMEQAKFSRWLVHGRLAMPDGQVRCLAVPHAEADATEYLAVHLPRLLAAPAAARNAPGAPANKLSLGPNPKHTRFQVLLAEMIAAWTGKETDRVAVAVDLSQEPGAVFEAGTKNRFACPVFSVNELRRLSALDAKSWKKTLILAALDELDRYRSFFPMIEKLAERGDEKRLESTLASFPLNEVALLASYWGDLGRRLPELSRDSRAALEFAVTATRGPRRVAIAWANDQDLFVRLTTAGDAPKPGEKSCPAFWLVPRYEALSL